MKITVMKFGGSSVADPEKILRAADRAVRERRRDRAVVVVVSAPGDMTDELLALARRVAPHPDSRELDQLLSTGEQVGVALFAMALHGRNLPAVSLTGAQAGITVRGRHGEAEIHGIRAEKILRELRKGRIVVVAGFQGLAESRDVATLGRGGSDLTAVALAKALKAASCEIFTDVKGVYTADPRLVSEARKLSSIDIAEMIELSRSGAQVMQTRSLEFARRFTIPLHVRSAFHPQEGTRIVPGRKLGEPPGYRFSAMALDRDGAAARIAVVGRDLGRPEAARRLLETLARHKIRARVLEASSLRLSIETDVRHGEAALRLLHGACGFKRP